MSIKNDTKLDQIVLLTNLLASANKETNRSIRYAAWASAFATGSDYVMNLVRDELGELSPPEKNDVEFAVARMGVTNPYFMAKQYVTTNAESSLNLRSFAKLNVQDEHAYHHACVAVSLINGGFVCLQSHVGQLQAARVSDRDIDVTMRIAAACHSLKILGIIPA